VRSGTDIRALAPRLARARPARGALAVGLATAMLLPASAPAATFSPGCGGGIGDSAALVNAVAVANESSPGPDTIQLAAGCIYSLAVPHNYWYGPNGLPPIASEITIEGHGATIARVGSAAFRFFFVGGDPPTQYATPAPHQAGHLTLREVTLSGGLSRGGDSNRGGGGAGLGGAIFNQGTLTVERSTLTANSAQGGAANFNGIGPGGGGLGPRGNLNHEGGGFGPGFEAVGLGGGGTGGAGSVEGAGGGGAGLGIGASGGSAAGAVPGAGGGSATGTGGRGGASGGAAGDGSGGGGSPGSLTQGGTGGGFGQGGKAAPGFGSTGGSGGGGGAGGGGAAGVEGADSEFVPKAGGSGGGGGFGGGGGAGGNGGNGTGGFSAFGAKAGGGGAGGFGGGGGAGGLGGFSAGMGGTPGADGAPGAPGFGGGTPTLSGGGGGAGMGGAIFNMQGQVTIRNSTLAGNAATGGDDAVADSGKGMGGAVFNLSGTLLADGSTLAANSADYDGSAIYNLVYDGKVARVAQVTLRDTIVTGPGPFALASNKSTYITPAQPAGSAANVDVGQFDLVTSMHVFDAGTITGAPLTADPLLGPLADNGGPTRTMALLPGSPALDAGSALGLSTDQRGLPRPHDFATTANAGDGSDVGAFELQPPPGGGHDGAGLRRPGQGDAAALRGRFQGQGGGGGGEPGEAAQAEARNPVRLPALGGSPGRLHGRAQGEGPPGGQGLPQADRGQPRPQTLRPVPARRRFRPAGRGGGREEAVLRADRQQEVGAGCLPGNAGRHRRRRQLLAPGTGGLHRGRG
jgi:hypothetical protein